MESHIRSGIEDTLKPIIKLFEREGASEYQIAMLKDVGPNALRSMLEFFEEKNSAWKVLVVVREVVVNYEDWDE